MAISFIDGITVDDDIVTTAGTDGGMRMGGWPNNPTGFSFIGTANTDRDWETYCHLI